MVLRSSSWSTLDPGTTLAALWRHLASPADPLALTAALLGLDAATARQLLGHALATSPEADRLLDGVQQLVRSLTITTADSRVRCHGEIRGPVLWSETAAARTASPGAGGVFICALPSKAYDTDENRVLVAALEAVRDAAADAMAGTGFLDDAQLRRAQYNGTRSTQTLEHRALASVPRGHLQPRARQRARQGARANAYAPAHALLDRARLPLGPAELAAWCDRRTTAQHHVLTVLADGLTARGLAQPAYQAEDGALVAGPITYRHVDAVSEAEIHGITVGDLLVDVPDYFDPSDPFHAEAALAARAGGRTVLLVAHPHDVGRAVELVAARVEG